LLSFMQIPESYQQLADSQNSIFIHGLSSVELIPYRANARNEDLKLTQRIPIHPVLFKIIGITITKRHSRTDLPDLASVFTMDLIRDPLRQAPDLQGVLRML
jgi:hypothetical protein